MDKWERLNSFQGWKRTGGRGIQPWGWGVAEVNGEMYLCADSRSGMKFLNAYHLDLPEYAHLREVSADIEAANDILLAGGNPDLEAAVRSLNHDRMIAAIYCVKTKTMLGIEPKK